MRINSVPDVKCFCNNKNVLCAQSMVWHFVRHPVHILQKQNVLINKQKVDLNPLYELAQDITLH